MATRHDERVPSSRTATAAGALGGGLLVGLAAAALGRRRRVADGQVRAIATSLQTALLPIGATDLDGIEVVVRYEAALSEAVVGGDWYDAFSVGDGERMLAVGDVSGHGTRAMATMARVLPTVRAHALSTTDPADLLDRLHDQLRGEPGIELCTACIARVDVHSGAVEIASAGHPAPIVRERSGRARVVGLPPGLLLGPDAEARHESVREELEPGDTLVLYTDGLVERRGEVIDQGVDRLLTTLEAGPADIDEMVDHLFAELVRTAPAQDDDAVVLLCCWPGPDGVLPPSVAAEDEPLCD